jgi:hypothetical protein
MGVVWRVTGSDMPDKNAEATEKTPDPAATQLLLLWLIIMVPGPPAFTLWRVCSGRGMAHGKIG